MDRLKAFKDENEAREDFMRAAGDAHKTSNGACVVISIEGDYLSVSAASQLDNNAIYSIVIAAAHVLSASTEREKMN